MVVRSLLLDTNLLCLLAVGLLGVDRISRHKRLAAYDAHDFGLLQDALASASRLVLSPQVYAETSNLIRQTAEPLRGESSAILRAIAAEASELNHPTWQSMQRDEYFRLGVTDSVLLMLNSEDCVLLTDDLDLYLAAARLDYPVINFNHLRESGGT